MPISYKHKIYTTLGTAEKVESDAVAVVTNSSGVPARNYSILGKSIVWNQMLQNPNFSNTVVDTRTYVQFMVLQNVSPYKIFLSLELQKPGLVSAIFTATASGECRIKHNGSKADIVFCYFTSVKDHKYYISFNFTSTNPTVAGGITFDKAQLFDLTKMFGAGNEPATPAEFRAMFPDDYYPYNAGELKSIMPTSIEASSPIRFNLLDTSGFTEKVNTIMDGITAKLDQDRSIYVTGTAVGDGGRNSWGLPVNLTANHKYYVTQIIDDMNGPFLSMVGQPSKYFSGQFITCDLSGQYNFGYNVKAGVTYDRHIYPMVVDLTEMYGAGNEPTTASAIPSFWGYNPDAYKRVNIPSLKYFPDGMRSAGSARDEIQNNEAIKRIGSVDLGTLNWALGGAGDNRYFVTMGISDIKKISGSSEIPGLLNAIYPAVAQTTWYLNKPCMFKIHGDTRAFCISDLAYTDAATFKAAMSGVMLYYELDTPLSTAITPPLQALPTYRGFNSFSVPNSLTQNGPLSVTYYAEGGTNPESGWLTSYKRKLYMGRSIEWNQLIDKSKPYFTGTYVNGGVTWINNGDGTYSVTGSPTTSTTAIVQKFAEDMPAGHVYYLCGLPTALSVTQDIIMGVYKNGVGVFTAYNQIKTAGAAFNEVRIVVIGGRSISNVLVKPQLFDLTQMFGAGNEPATPAEFWSYFDHKLYPYNPGETQPLFKISRKSQWGSGL